VVERFVYDPYGQVTVLAPDWSGPISDAYSWVYLYQGGRYDATSGLYDFRNRDYSPTLGRWLQQDPVGYAGGTPDLYQMEGNNPVNTVDPEGLEPIPGEVFINGPGRYLIIKDLVARFVGGNKYGEFFIHAEHTIDAVGFDRLNAHIFFKPTREACCGEIAFLQVARTMNTAVNRPIKRAGVAPMNAEGWHIDNVPGSRYGWYGYSTASATYRYLFQNLWRFQSNDLSLLTWANLYTLSGVPGRNLGVMPLYSGQTGMAWLGDQPALYNNSERQDFVTCAVCRHGKDVGRIYGCIKWGHELDKKGNYEELKPEFVDSPGPEFWSAIGAWNINAEENKRNEGGRFPIRVPEPIPAPELPGELFIG
jgi:RHS repeat-associated protein